LHPQLHVFFDGLAILVLAIGAHFRLRWHPAYTPSLLLDGLINSVWAGLLAAWLPNLITPLRAVLTGDSIPLGWWRAGLDNWMLAVAGAALAGYVFLRRRNLPVLLVFDAFAPLLAIALAVVRIGCAVNGDAFGKVTTSWVAMWLPDVNGTYAWRYPAQYVSIAMNLFIAWLILGFEWQSVHRWHKRRGWPFDGFLFCLYLILYCAQRFYFEFWRGDKPIIAGAFTITHVYCVLGIALACWLIWYGWRLHLPDTGQQQKDT